MRIGEVAALAGVSVRTVRHYHQLGLLPEPPRHGNGYRDYRLRDAVLLARVRRLAELGLPLEEIGEVLADERGRDLRDVLQELDADLARQQEAIAERRRRLAGLLAEADLHPDSTVSPELAEVLRELPVEGSKFARLDRDVFTLFDSADPVARAGVAGLFKPLLEPEALARAHDLYARLDELEGAAADDPRVAALAEELAAHLPAEMTDALAGQSDRAWLEAIAPEMSQAQEQVLHRLVTIIEERS